MQHEYYEASILTTPCPFPSQNIEERSWGAVLVWSSSSFSSSPDGRTLILIWWRVERSREREREREHGTQESHRVRAGWRK